MDSLILNQSLEIYGQSLVAICRLPCKTSEGLNLLKKGWSHVVIVNQNDQPQGLFNARCLLNWQSSSDACKFAAPSIALADIDLEPLPSIAFSMTVVDFLQRISQYRHSAEIWALVDGDGKFMAILEVVNLLRSLVQEQESMRPSASSMLLPLIYQLPLPVMVSDRNGAIVGMNSAWRNSLHESLPQKSSDESSLVASTTNINKSLVAINDQDSAHLLAPNLPETHQFCTTDGESLTWQVINVALQGSLQGLELAIAYDITSQKNLAQELSGLSRIKDEFLTCINHELKTPLTSVIGIASLLSNSTFGELNAHQSRYVKMIHQSGRQLVSIIDNIFDLAKAEAGQLELYVEMVSVRDACQKSIQQVQKLVLQNPTLSRNHNFEEGWQLDIRLDIAPSVHSIIADEARLQQMLVSLLSNAFKFSVLPSELINDGPSLAPKIGISVGWWEGWLAITVWDQGIGIPEEKQYLVFQKFQQLENVMTRRFEGTGASLLLTRHLARLHGGDITFVSQVDVGSQFTILLPTEPNNLLTKTVKVDLTTEQSPNRSLNQSPNRSRLVLIVETSMEALEYLRTMLSNLQYQAVVARTGTEALEKARRLQPCLILLSPNLPMLSGWDVLALLKGDALTQHIRVVMMKHADEPQLSSHQADGILFKPIKAIELSGFLPDYISLPKSMKFLYLNQNISNFAIDLFQELGHSLIEADDLNQCDVLCQIWRPDLFLLDGDNEFLLTDLDTISQLNLLSNLPILLIMRSPTSKLNWLKKRFTNLRLYEYTGLELEKLDTNRSEILHALSQAVTNAMCFAISPVLN